MLSECSELPFRSTCSKPMLQPFMLWSAASELAFVPLYFANSLVTAIIGCVAVGIGFAGVITTMDLVGARILDDDTRKHGIKREGIYSSAMGFMNRLSGLFTSLAFLLVSVIYGFESGDIPGPNPGAASRFLLVIFPFCTMIFSVFFSRFLKFPEIDGKTK